MMCQTCRQPSDTYECDDCYVRRTELDALRASAVTFSVVAAIALLILFALIGVAL